MIQKHITKYYRTERVSSFALMCFGAFSSSIGLAYYLISGSSLSLGIMLGICILGSYQITAGLIRILRSVRRYKNSITGQGADTASFLRSMEYPRIQKKEQRFHKMRMLELSGIALGFGLILLCMISHNTTYLLGTATGLTLQSGFLLAFDLFGQYRLQEYLHQLHKFLG